MRVGTSKARCYGNLAVVVSLLSAVLLLLLPFVLLLLLRFAAFAAALCSAVAVAFSCWRLLLVFVRVMSHALVFVLSNIRIALQSMWPYVYKLKTHLR